MTRASLKRKQSVANLSVDELRKMITEIVRKVVREETHRDYYVNEDGIKVLYEEEPVDPDYLEELNAHAKAIKEGKMKLVSADEIKKELRKIGARV